MVLFLAAGLSLGSFELLKGAPSIMSRNSLTVHISYVGMGTKSETLTMPSPSSLTDLLLRLEKAHPSLVAMLPGMQTLVNGTAAVGNPQLVDGDSISFLPLFSGG
jgi:ThiS family